MLKNRGVSIYFNKFITILVLFVISSSIVYAGEGLGRAVDGAREAFGRAVDAVRDFFSGGYSV